MYIQAIARNCNIVNYYNYNYFYMSLLHNKYCEKSTERRNKIRNTQSTLRMRANSLASALAPTSPNEILIERY